MGDMTMTKPSEPPSTAMVKGRLQPGDDAPLFTGTHLDGRPVSLADFRGAPLWLALFRYAACPFCSYRVHRLVREYSRVLGAGLKILAAFPSPQKRLEKYVQRYKPEFDIIADPQEEIYQLYHAETSWTGELLAAVNLPNVVRVMVHAPNNPFAVDGPIHRMPSEFLLDRDLKIAVAHYGRTPDDGIEVDAAIAWASELPAPA
jgi:peroxiredoxin